MDRNDDITLLRNLGSQGTDYKYDQPIAGILECFPNKYPDRDYKICFTFDEFTSLCPKTGQPDFGTIVIEYIPNKMCIESKSLKLYLFAYRQCGSFMETLTNRILEDCVTACLPKWMKVTGVFKPRGAVQINVDVVYNETN